MLAFSSPPWLRFCQRVLFKWVPRLPVSMFRREGIVAAWFLKSRIFLPAKRIKGRKARAKMSFKILVFSKDTIYMVMRGGSDDNSLLLFLLDKSFS